MQKLLAVLVCALFAAGLYSGRVAAADGDTIHFGLNYELTGSNPIIGESSIQGVSLALEEINAAGGVKIGGKQYKLAVKPLDNEFNPESAAVVAQTFADDSSIVAMIGPNDSAMCLGSQAIVETGLPAITPWATQVDITSGRYFFRACFTDDFQGEILAKYAYDYEKCARAAVLYDMSNDYNVGVSKIFRASFEKLGGKVVEYQSYNANEKDFSAQLTKIIAADPEIILLPNFYAEVVDQAEQARALGYTGKFIGSDTWGDQLLLDLDKNRVFEGCVWCGHYAVDIASDKALAFIAAYHKKYGRDVFPNDIVALNYDAVNLLKLGIEKAQSTARDAIRDGLASIDIYEGVTGTMRFHGSGDPTKSAVMIKIEDGQFKFLDVINPQ
ncbi:MAG: ABC transporter substrate-binding protein [Planctomycetota bacterium]|jgi:branched-chain amino acid transport system substrate-binding protein|nr:ABC transporter substrate-binding protein [Planctomycetota bacterium]